MLLIYNNNYIFYYNTNLCFLFVINVIINIKYIIFNNKIYMMHMFLLL